MPWMRLHPRHRLLPAIRLGRAAADQCSAAAIASRSGVLGRPVIPPRVDYSLTGRGSELAASSCP
jgi:hypothetical protein